MMIGVYGNAILMGPSGLQRAVDAGPPLTPEEVESASEVLEAIHSNLLGSFNAVRMLTAVELGCVIGRLKRKKLEYSREGLIAAARLLNGFPPDRYSRVTAEAALAEEMSFKTTPEAVAWAKKIVDPMLPKPANIPVVRFCQTDPNLTAVYHPLKTTIINFLKGIFYKRLKPYRTGELFIALEEGIQIQLQVKPTRDGYYRMIVKIIEPEEGDDDFSLRIRMDNVHTEMLKKLRESGSSRIEILREASATSLKVFFPATNVGSYCFVVREFLAAHQEILKS